MEILLGYGVWSVGGVPVGRTRGGGNFTVEREYRDIEADGDYGPVKDRTVIDREVATLSMNELTFFDIDLIKSRMPGLDVTSLKATSTLEIATTDYNDVVWVGKTKSGKDVTITVSNAINFGNLELPLVDKEEVVPEITYTGTYLENARKTSTWSIDYTSGDQYNVTFTISDSVGVVEGAEVIFNNQLVTTNASGVALFANVSEATNKPFQVIKGGYATYFGSVDVDGVEAVAVTIVAN